MTRTFQRLLPRNIAGQITGLVVVSLIVAYSLFAGIIFLAFYDISDAKSGAAIKARIATIAQLANAAQSPDQLAGLLAMTRRAGMTVDQVPLAEILPEADRPGRSPSAAWLIQLERAYNVDVLGTTDNHIVIRLAGNDALVFRKALHTYPFPFKAFTIPALFALTIIAAFATFLSVYAGRWITSPLSSFAAAAHSFGRSPADDRDLRENGPREIAQVARALNDMRRRIRALMDNRTRMLAAIGHDLRTPLTRLRLRVERLGDAGTRDGMLREIETVDTMLDETLAYIRDEARSEQTSRVDLPSLLQTICSEFSDVGHQVAYCGPDRSTYVCRPSSLTRALTNIVENSIKYGSTVAVQLHAPAADSAIQIDISDDGPGIPHSLREKAFEPFFKGDAARAASERTGFGLGLSIARDVVRAHGGEIHLLDRTPRGMTVRIVLPGAESDLPPESMPDLEARSHAVSGT